MGVGKRQMHAVSRNQSHTNLSHEPLEIPCDHRRRPFPRRRARREGRNRPFRRLRRRGYEFDLGVREPGRHRRGPGGSPPLANGMAARLTNLNGSNNNSIAFDAVPIQGGRIILELDFRMSDDAANATAGGCCNEAADGMAFGFFDTGTYGLAGALNPAGAGQNWEDPSVSPGFPGALVIGLDVFDGGGPVGNTVRVGGPGGAVDVLFTGNAPFPLNNNLFHRARLTATDSGPNALLSLALVEDVGGAAIEHVIFSNVTVLNFDLDAVSARLIAGGRTGAAFVQTEIDNIRVDVNQGDDLDGDGMADFWEEFYGVDDPDGHDDGDPPGQPPGVPARHEPEGRGLR